MSGTAAQFGYLVAQHYIDAEDSLAIYILYVIYRFQMTWPPGIQPLQPIRSAQQLLVASYSMIYHISCW